MLVLIGIIAFIVRKTIIIFNPDERNVTAVLIRMLFDHFHLIFIMSLLDLDYPQFVANYFIGVRTISQVVNMILQIDCFMVNNNNDIYSSSF